MSLDPEVNNVNEEYDYELQGLGVAGRKINMKTLRGVSSEGKTKIEYEVADKSCSALTPYILADGEVRPWKAIGILQKYLRAMIVSSL